MPYVWVEPETFLEYSGVTIYHVYRNDNINDVRVYLYTVDITESSAFDIRDLPEYEEALSHDEIFRRAVDRRSPVLQAALEALDV